MGTTGGVRRDPTVVLPSGPFAICSRFVNENRRSALLDHGICLYVSVDTVRCSDVWNRSRLDFRLDDRHIIHAQVPKQPKPGVISRAQAFGIRVHKVSNLAPVPASYEYTNLMMSEWSPWPLTRGRSPGFSVTEPPHGEEFFSESLQSLTPAEITHINHQHRQHSACIAPQEL